MHDPALLTALERRLHVWIAYPDRLALPELADRHLPLLDAEEAARYHRFYFDKDRQHYLAAHALLRLTLSRYAPVRPEDWRFERGPKGKPEIAASHGLPRLRFNLSHTQGLVACVLALDCPCGIDVEHLRTMRDMQGVAENVFSGMEIAWLQAQPEDQKAETFFTFWTLKEAYIKATGQGLAAPLQSISFDIASPLIGVAFGEDVADDPQRWMLRHWKLANDHQLSVAARTGPLEAVDINELDLVDLHAKTIS